MNSVLYHVLYCARLHCIYSTILTFRNTYPVEKLPSVWPIASLCISWHLWHSGLLLVYYSSGVWTKNPEYSSTSFSKWILQIIKRTSPYIERFNWLCVNKNTVQPLHALIIYNVSTRCCDHCVF